MTSDDPIDALDAALRGDRDALEQLVIGLQDRIYNLALRMLWHPEDARDATQEILIRIITHLSDFERRSSLSTWTYRVACNYLLTTRKRRAEMEEVTFEVFAQGLETGFDRPPVVPEAEQALLEEEVKIGCTQAMLLCLDREHRLTYILGEIMALPADQGAAVMNIAPAAYRKRLSRARERVAAFLARHCGLVRGSSACRCASRIGVALARGRIDRSDLLFAGRRAAKPELNLSAAVSELNAVEAAAQVYRGHPSFATPAQVLESLRALLTADRLQVLRSGEGSS